MYYFYILRSISDNKFYYGSTSNLKQRLYEHQSGKVVSTKSRLPLELLYYEAYKELGQARKRERQVKKSGNARKVLLSRIQNKHP
jgi:putative endonuclease